MILRANLKAANGLTKYPSIPTYHALGDRGRVTDTVQVPFAADEALVVTEKIDGTNARIICHAGDYLIGSREELLTARGDCIHNPSMGIVDAVRAVAESLSQSARHDAEVCVVYGEVYGGKVTGASKQYTSTGAIGFRVFDVAVFEAAEFEDRTRWPPEKIAAWRDNGGQSFLDWESLRFLCGALSVGIVPTVGARSGLALSPADTLAWMRQAITQTQAGIDANGRPEGLVVRTADRKQIAKLRFEDYERGQKR